MLRGTSIILVDLLLNQLIWTLLRSSYLAMALDLTQSDAADLAALQKDITEVWHHLARDITTENATYTRDEEEVLRVMRARHDRAIQHIRTRAKQEVQRLAARACSIKARHNAMQPINKLPPEVLSSEIFAWVKRVVNGHSMAWTRVALVCSRWRQDAIGDLHLWTDIETKHIHWELLRTILQRSKGLPLSITTNAFSSEAHVTLLRQHVRRLRMLSTTDYPSMVYLHNAINALNRPAPLLEELVLGSHNLGHGIQSYIRIPRRIFAGVNPQLTRLTLRGHFFFPLPSPLLRHVTMLNLNGLGSVEFEYIYGMLRATPQLQHLSFECYGPMSRDAEQPIIMPHLKHVQMTLLPEDGLAFLKTLAPPLPACRIVLNAWIPRLPDVSLDMLEQLLLFAQQNLECLDFPILNIRQGVYPHLNPAEGLPKPAPSTPPAQSTFELRAMLECPFESSILTSISYCPMKRLHLLDFEALFPVQSATWCDMLRLLPELRTLRMSMSYTAYNHFVVAFDMLHGPSVDSKESTRVLPLLHSLDLGLQYAPKDNPKNLSDKTSLLLTVLGFRKNRRFMFTNLGHVVLRGNLARPSHFARLGDIYPKALITAAPLPSRTFARHY